MFRTDSITWERARTFVPLVLVVLFGSALTALATWGSWQVEDQRLRGAVERRVETHTRALEHGIATGLHEVEILRGLFIVSDTVSAETFQAFVDNIGVRWQGILTLGWIPAPGDGDTGIRLDHCAPASSCSGDFIAALTASDDLRALLRRATSVKRTVISAPLDLPRAAASKYNLVITPVFHPSADAGGGQVRGFALGVFVIGDLVELILGEQTVPSGLDLYFYQGWDEGADRLIYYHPTRTAADVHPPLPRAELMRLHPYLRRFPVADSVWTIAAQPDPRTLSELKTFEPWIVLNSGLLVTLLLAGYIMANLRRTARIEAIVEARTKELHATNILVNRAREEAEQANQAKTRFLAAASHDLRQPLQALNLFVNVLSSRDHDKKTREIVEYIGESTQSLESLLNALLDISKLEAGLVVPKFGDVRVEELFSRLENHFAPLAAAKGLKLKVKPLPLVLRTDPTLIENIMRNLLANAVRYTQKGRIVVRCQEVDGSAALAVEDTGPGIPEDQRETVFREFARLDRGREGERDDGLGLGLAIVDRLARLLNHRVGISSSNGHGSVFVVEVPVSGNVERKAKPDKLDAAERGPDSRVLVIDDEPDVLRAMRVQLEEWGYSVETASSLDQALEIISPAGSAIKLILADYRLGGGVTGVQAIGAIREQLGDDVPGLLITGNTAPDQLREAQSSGLRFLHKPVPPAILHRAVTEALESAVRGT
jgi:signal transduction histidine kinase/ActR/RegA family two-component response regulator